MQGRKMSTCRVGFERLDSRIAPSSLLVSGSADVTIDTSASAAGEVQDLNANAAAEASASVSANANLVVEYDR